MVQINLSRYVQLILDRMIEPKVSDFRDVQFVPNLNVLDSLVSASSA